MAEAGYFASRCKGDDLAHIFLLMSTAGGK
jgi:hypothetical protein